MVKKKLTFKNIILVLVVLMSMALIVFLVGRAFGFFTYEKHGNIVNSITIKGLSVNIDNETDDALNITNAYPVYDSEGLENDAFIFTITNHSSNSIEYNLKVENDADKLAECVAQNTTCPELSTSYIRYSYKINDGYWSSPSNLGDDDNILFSDAILGNGNTTVSIKLWVDSAAGNEIQGTNFFGKLILEGMQTTGEKVKVTFDDNINLIYSLPDNEQTITSEKMQYSITDGVVEVTALQDDGFGFTTGKVDLEAGKKYIFNCNIDGAWRMPATAENGYSDTVEAFLMLNGQYNTFYRIETYNNFEFIPSVSGTYYLRLDVNQQGKTYHFWNISITEKKNYSVKHVTVGENYDNLPTPTRDGYTFLGWHGKNLFYGEVESGKLDNDTGAIVGNSSTSCIRSKEFIPVKGNTTYTVFNNMEYSNYIYEYNINKEFIKYTDVRTTPYTFTTTQETAYVKVRTRTTENEDDLSTLFQLEEGTTVTDYEPYYITSNTTVAQNQNHTLTAVWQKNN